MDASTVILLIAVAVAVAAISWLLGSRLATQSREKDEERFRQIASDIMMQNSVHLRDDNERRLSEILNPLRENLKEFRKTIYDSYSAEARERFSLREQIGQLIQRNEAISRDARELAMALKGNNRVQGQWGEMVLRNIFEKSGLRAGEEFFLQETTSNESGDRLRPDAIVSFPDGRKLVIDSKTSLQAYFDMVETSDAEMQKTFTKMHVASIKNHINELRVKNYQDYVGKSTADFVMMFIPNEGAYLAAMQADNSLWQYAYDSRVIIVSPTHLLSVVKLVEQLWRTDRQERNALQIAVEGGRLIDKLVSFISDMERIKSNLESAQKAYETAMTRLNGRGGIISRAEKLNELGAKASKKLPNNQDNT